MHLWVESEEQGLEPVLMLEAEAEVEMRRVAVHGVMACEIRGGRGMEILQEQRLQRLQ